ncbi:DUF4350 domain-containing protein [Euzebyella saccharophila]|uniref:DUF4350 domain-containing protein n=1 Tax=Euzebyella saccharophila TaxID=679664 RepID=A0ABV8JIP9_9FLAO|nr:DUF4350 domain-containing protein [Euzebyella saccharophila]
MGKRLIKYIILIVITVGALLLAQYNKPKEINWLPSFVNDHKIPYGTKVFNEYVQEKFKNVKQVNVPPFEFLAHQDSINGTYVFINNDVTFGEVELHRILDWTSKGNSLFIASSSFEQPLLDTLKLETNNLYNSFENGKAYEHRLVNPQLGNNAAFTFEKDSYTTYFTQDSLPGPITVLGTVSAKNDSVSTKGPSENYNVIRKKYGKGEIILSTFPKAFTNYFILKDHHKEYTAGLISYWDESRSLYLDNHYKSGKSIYTSPMYIFLNIREFKWAYYLALLGVLLYVVFEGKRKQRAIPVIEPLKNQTLAFTRTIADMYYESGETKAIAKHKIDYFLDYVRNHFYFQSIEKTEDFYQNLASRSSHEMEEVEQLFNYINQIESKETITDTELQKLNSLIEKFKKKAHGN